MKGPILDCYLCFFAEKDGGPKFPVGSGNRSLLFRFAGDVRDFGATVDAPEGEVGAGHTGEVTLHFMVQEAFEAACAGALFEIRLGPRLVGIGRVA